MNKAKYYAAQLLLLIKRGGTVSSYLAKMSVVSLQLKCASCKNAPITDVKIINHVEYLSVRSQAANR